MSGKAYTMKEMKGIVEYLTEHRAYGEIKGRKMWMDYANSKLTTRTWQSLKETFLKRILPDITNPYYKLTVEQVASFQQGTDLQAKINNKLEIQTIHDDTSSDSHKNDPQTSNTNNTKGGDDAGEDILCNENNEHRSSTETVVIEPCYRSAKDILKDLESPTKENTNGSPIACSTKSIRDFITYSEPLTPMLQEVLHDFASEDEGDEPPMQIVEYPEPCKRNEGSSPVEILDSEIKDVGIENIENVNTIKDKNNDENSVEKNINENVLESDVNDGFEKSDEVQCIEDSEKTTENTTETDIVPNETDTAANNSTNNNDESNIQSAKLHSISNSMTDSCLPNNQEALKDYPKATDNSPDKQNPENLRISLTENLSSNETINGSRKRSKSTEKDCVAPKKRPCPDTIEKLSDRGTKEQKTKTTFKSKTQLKRHANSDQENNANNNPVKDKTDEVTSEQQTNPNPNKNGESVYISDDSLSKRHEIPEDISIKADEDDLAITSEGKESSKTNKSTRSTPNKRKIRTNQNENPVYKKEVINDVVVLKSHSESTSDHAVSSKKNKASLRAAHKMHRDRALANVFGFSSGVKSNRKKYKNLKRRSSNQRSSGSEWTSDTGTEYISPPRGRKNKQNRRYLKPKSARILSLEEEGGLFVMYGKKIYPVVKDGKLMKNYVNYTPDNDSEDDESYWKLKYVEEKKKTDELTKLLKHKKRESVPGQANEAPPQADVCEKPSTVTEPPKENNEKVKDVEQTLKVPEKKEATTQAKTLKIQFIKNNETVQLEGHWSQIHPVLDQVVQILHKEPEPREKQPPEPKENLVLESKDKSLPQPAEKPKPDSKEKSPLEPKPKYKPEKRSVQRSMSLQVLEAYHTPKKQKISRDSTPISTIQLDEGEDVQEKIDKLEEEIFKEIQEREIAESSQDDTATANVTKRKGRPTKSSNVNKADGVSEALRKKPATRLADEESNDSSIATRRQSRTPRKANDKETIDKVATEAKRATRKSSRHATSEKDDDSVKYKFPTSPQAQHVSNRSKANKKMATKQASKRRYPIKTGRIFSSPDNISIDSIESSQGYLDSEPSTLSICLRKKRRLSLTVLNRGRRLTQRRSKSKPLLYLHDVSSDSNVSFVTALTKSSKNQSSSLNTEVYRSESYQNLFPQRKNSIQHLEKIDEKSPVASNINCLNKTDNAATDMLGEKSSINENNSLSPAFANYGEYSSNVTLPLSPVLSIVEKLSLSKSALENTKNIDTPEDEDHDQERLSSLNDYMLSDVDMTMPLMDQECNLQKSSHKETQRHFNLNVPETSQQISDSLVSKVGAVNITEPTLSESIHQKLKNLLLESAKKIAKQMNENNDNCESNRMEICESVKQNKTKAKKRCSTPRKRIKQSSKSSNPEPHDVVEEHIQSCGNEKSQPAPMLIVTDDNDNAVTTDVSDARRSERLKKKKDVIKVKITKPKKKKKEDTPNDKIQKEAKTSLQADSGINDTESGVFLRGLDDSVDLIHNHSDTCLQAHECLEDSVQIIDDNAMSVISLNSESVPVNAFRCASPTTPIEDKLLDICCENAQDATKLFTATETPERTPNGSVCLFKSPTDNISPGNSLLTDDLSDGIVPDESIVQKRISKWYLLSEDEASNTNNVDMAAPLSNSNLGCGANLQEIFPITCAVPDLSTITEENTFKFTIDGNTRSEFDSQSLPNV